MELYMLWQRLEGEQGHQVGRQLLQRLYTTYAGEKMPEICIAPKGKPYFKDENWYFSISHCKNHAFCVLCSCPVGLDAEELSRSPSPILAEKALSSMEKQQYDAATDKRKALLTFWVLKEAAGKLTGEGIGFHPNHTEFMLTDSRVQEIDGCLVAIVTEEK